MLAEYSETRERLQTQGFDVINLQGGACPDGIHNPSGMSHTLQSLWWTGTGILAILGLLRVLLWQIPLCGICVVSKYENLL
jgi:hypothetical protein